MTLRPPPSNLSDFPADPVATPWGSNTLPSLRIGGAVLRGPVVPFFIDGQAVEAFSGESVAAALYCVGLRTLRQSPRGDLPRGLFCLMGSCQECLVWFGLEKLPSCQLPVTAGMVVETLSYREQYLREHSHD
jgi:hypothetical protein